VIALAITILAEGIIASAILRRIPWLETIAIQLTTWPIAQWLLWRTGAFWSIELGVTIVETLFWRAVLPLSWKRATLVSCAANGATVAIALALR
jgi:hypothetical protein